MLFTLHTNILAHTQNRMHHTVQCFWARAPILGQHTTQRERHECKQTNAHTHTDAICNCINRDVCVCKTAERYQSGCFSVTTYTHTLVWADFVNTAASRPNYKINIFGISKLRLRPLAHRHTIAHGCRKCATSKPTTTSNQKNVRNNFGHKSPVRAGVEKLADAAGPVW